MVPMGIGVIPIHFVIPIGGYGGGGSIGGYTASITASISASDEWND